MNEVAAIVLGGGEGTRLNDGRPSPKPKVLYEVNGRPLVSYPINSLKKVGLSKIIIVVGYKADDIKSALGPQFEYAIQPKPLGTADAVSAGLSKVQPATDHVIVLYGADIYSDKLLGEVIKLHLSESAKVTFVTKIMENPGKLGRIVRDDEGKVAAIVEEKVATEVQKKIKEVNDGCFIFEKDWLIKSIEGIKLSAAKEYFLTDLVEIAIKKGEKVATYTIQSEKDWIGVDSPEDIINAEKLLGGEEK